MSDGFPITFTKADDWLSVENNVAGPSMGPKDGFGTPVEGQPARESLWDGMVEMHEPLYGDEC